MADDQLSGLKLDLAVALACNFPCSAGGPHDWIPSLATACAKCRHVLPLYSHSIEAAMQVVERLINDPFHYRALTDQGGDHKSVLVEIKRISGGEWIYIARVEAETLPLAICRAALAAIGANK